MLNLGLECKYAIDYNKLFYKGNERHYKANQSKN